MSDYAKDCLAVLKALDAGYQQFSEGGEIYYPFNSIRKHGVNLPYARVRVLCRALKRKGLAKFLSGLCTEDGEFAGSGYAITEAGHAFLGTAQAREEA